MPLIAGHLWPFVARPVRTVAIRIAFLKKPGRRITTVPVAILLLQAREAPERRDLQESWGTL